MDEYYQINKDELIELLHDSMKLTILEKGGVKDWQWYNETIHDWENSNGDLYSVARERLAEYKLIEDFKKD